MDQKSDKPADTDKTIKDGLLKAVTSVFDVFLEIMFRKNK